MNINMNIAFTEHAKDRLKERNGWSKKASERMMKKILEDGEDMEVKKGYLGNWARAKKKENENHTFVLYGTQVYIFDENTLITVFPTPSRQQALKRAAGGR